MNKKLVMALIKFVFHVTTMLAYQSNIFPGSHIDDLLQSAKTLTDELEKVKP